MKNNSLNNKERLSKHNIIYFIVFGAITTFLVPLLAKYANKWIIILTPLLIVYWVYIINTVNKTIKMSRPDEIKAGLINDLIRPAKKIRHDFVNHFQVIYSLVQLIGEKRLFKYLKRINTMNDIIGSIIKLSQYDLIIFFMNCLAESEDFRGKYKFNNYVSWDNLENSLGSDIVVILEKIYDRVQVDKINDESAMIEWELGDNSNNYIITFMVYDPNELWKENEKNIIELQEEVSELGLDLVYLSREEYVSFKLNIPKRKTKNVT